MKQVKLTKKINKATVFLQDIGLLDTSNSPKKLHWLHTKLLQTYDNDEILSSPLYTILEAYPPGSMLVDTDGAYWVRRATAAVTDTDLLLSKTKKHTMNKNTCSQYLLHQQMMLLLIHHYLG